MAAVVEMKVAHLSATAGYRVSQDYDPSKPTMVLINAMCTTASLFDAQFEDKAVTDAMNLVAIEPLGHGKTTTRVEHFTFWDSAILALEVLNKLGIDRAFVLGTSQGGWIAVRMALLCPFMIRGVMLLGTSMDYESSASRAKGCWDPSLTVAPFLQNWKTAASNPDFVIEGEWIAAIMDLGFGEAATPGAREFWSTTLKEVYKGCEGAKKVRMATLALLSRDGLLLRLSDLKCPVHWLQGTNDIPYGTQAPKEHFDLFTSVTEASMTIVPGGYHYLNATNPDVVNMVMVDFVGKHRWRLFPA